MTDPTFPAFRAGEAGCPRLTATLPALGGQLGPDFDDFQVDEIPAYAPSGEGDHFFVKIRKRDLSTEFACRQLARAVGLQARNFGIAGRKDRRAVTTQWISMPTEPVDPEFDGLEILEVVRHQRKLKRGHLKGNRFSIRLVDLHPEAAERLPALLEAVGHGIPNYFGEQRFGRENLEKALVMLGRKRRGKDDGFLASALQSAIFNHWLGARVSRGELAVALTGDVLKKRETGGLFACEDAPTDTARLAAGELDPTGPMIGPKMWAATDAAGAHETAAADAFALTEKRLAKLGKLASGTRRLARVVPQDLSVEFGPERTAWVRFTLPSGCYATVVLDELCHPEGAFRR